MLDFYKGSEWMSYSLPQDEDHELLVPFPWDELYVHYLEAMVYYSNGEFDRYRNSYEMFNKKELDYRQWYARNQLPTTLEALERPGLHRSDRGARQPAVLVSERLCPGCEARLSGHRGGVAGGYQGRAGAAALQ